MGFTCRSCKCYGWFHDPTTALEAIKKDAKEDSVYTFYGEKISLNQLILASEKREVWLGWCYRHEEWVLEDPISASCDNHIDLKAWAEEPWIGKVKCSKCPRDCDDKWK